MDEAWQQQIRQRALAIWEREGRPAGDPEQFNTLAEQASRQGREELKRLAVRQLALEQHASLRLGRRKPLRSGRRP